MGADGQLSGCWVQMGSSEQLLNAEEARRRAAEGRVAELEEINIRQTAEARGTGCARWLRRVPAGGRIENC